jgi:hypothetical protein
MTQDTQTHADKSASRNVGAALGIGILLLPFLFAWFTLRKGYSKFARVLSLGWMFLILLIIMGGQQGNNASNEDQPIDDQIEQELPASSQEASPAEGSEPDNGSTINLPAGVSYILVSGSDDGQECENLRNLSNVKKDQTSCISDREQWRRLCASVKIINGENVIFQTALDHVAGYMASMGETNNSAYAVESVVKNGGVYGRKVYWNEAQENTNKSCKISFSAKGMYEGTTISENFSGYASEIGVNDDGTSTIVNAIGGQD